MSFEQKNNISTRPVQIYKGHLYIYKDILNIKTEQVYLYLFNFRKVLTNKLFNIALIAWFL